MEMAMELEDDLFFADLTKQISLLIMDDDDQDPIASCPSVSLQAHRRKKRTPKAHKAQKTHPKAHKACASLKQLKTGSFWVSWENVPHKARAPRPPSVFSPALLPCSLSRSPSFLSLAGSCCKLNSLLYTYLVLIFLLILGFIAFTVFTLFVTNKGIGQAVLGRGYKEYKVGDFSHWLQHYVVNGKTGSRSRVVWWVLRFVRVSAGDVHQTQADFYRNNLSPIQAFSCAIHQPAQVPVYEQSCKRETKGTGVFIPQSTVPRRKQNRQGKYTNAYNNTKSQSRSQLADQRNRKMVSQLPSDFVFRARNGRE